MAFYYVKHNGTATGDAGRYASKQTGSFAGLGTSGYYASVAAAVAATTAPVAGDYVLVSSSHVQNVAVGQLYITVPTGVVVICVSDAAIDTMSEGAVFDTASGNVYAGTDGAGGFVAYYGLTIKPEDDFILGTTAAASEISLNNCVIDFSLASQFSDNIASPLDGALVTLRDCNIKPTDTTGVAAFALQSGAIVSWFGGTLQSVTNPTEYLLDPLGTGGCSLLLDSVDLSAHSGIQLMDSQSGASEDSNTLTLRNCKLPASYTLAATMQEGSWVLLENCHSSGKYASAFMNYVGSFDTSTLNTRTGGATVDGQLISYDVATTTHAVKGFVAFRFKIGAVKADFSTAKTLTVHVMHDSQGNGTSSDLTDVDAWLEAYVPISGGPQRKFYTNRNSNPFEVTGTDHADESSETWTTTGITTPVKQSLSITTAGGDDDGIADVWFCLSIPSISAGDVFVDPKIEVS